MQKIRSLVTNADLSPAEMLEIVKSGAAIAAEPAKYADVCRDRCARFNYFEHFCGA